MELDETIDLMLSEDYKDRFKAEVKQLEIRIKKLTSLLENWDNLNFTPKCPYNVLKSQLDTMNLYLDILKNRAILEDIKV